MKYSVGSVPYLNAKPLVRQFEDLGPESPVQVLYDVPSRLPGMLATNEVQAIMVSSIESLRTPGKRITDGVCIGTQREVLSVRVFSKAPPCEIRTLALDQSSMTSNGLAQIILKERYGCGLICNSEPPVLAQMLEGHDACVLIGDNGIRESGAGLHILDLGYEWFELTALPFVWAVWMGDANLTPELAGYLQEAMWSGFDRMDSVIADAPNHTGIQEDLCRKYLTEIMHYPMQERELEGLREFGRKLVAHGILKETHWPEIVNPS